MEFKLTLILKFCIIFCIQCNFWSVDAIAGVTVRQAEANEAPYIVAFMRNIPENNNPYEKFFCAGTVVTRQHVLSTAHCILLFHREETVILAGSNNLWNGHLYNILWWVTYAEYANYKHKRVLLGINDISMTKISGSFHDSIPSAIISPIFADHLPGREAILPGWGRTITGEMSLSLLVGKVSIITNHECEIRIRSHEERKVTVHDRYICTVQEPFVVLQEGDLGGPIISGDYVIGVNKETRPYPTNDFHPDNVNLHMSVDYYRAFIRDTTAPNYTFNSSN